MDEATDMPAAMALNRPPRPLAASTMTNLTRARCSASRVLGQPRCAASSTFACSSELEGGTIIDGIDESEEIVKTNATLTTATAVYASMLFMAGGGRCQVSIARTGAATHAVKRTTKVSS